VTRADRVDHDDEVEEMAAEMAAGGADPDAVAAFLEASLEDDEDFADDDPDLWPENAEAFAVFTRCKWQRDVITGMDGGQVLYSGIDASEIRATCELLGVPAERWPAVLSGVRTAEAVVLPILNDRS
jgi:hypothetical protein